MSTQTCSHVVPLDCLKESESGQIVELVAEENWLHRLAELGLREGVNVQMVKAGEPCIIAVAGQRFSFRCDPSTLILVEVPQ